MPRKLARYTENDKSNALTILSECAGNISEASRRTGWPPQSIRNWRDGVGINDAITKSSDQKKSDLAQLFEDMANQALKRAGIEIDNASYAQLMTGAAIAVDKMRLLSELPTSNENVKQTIRVVYDDSPPSTS